MLYDEIRQPHVFRRVVALLCVLFRLFDCHEESSLDWADSTWVRHPMMDPAGIQFSLSVASFCTRPPILDP